jgi:hypothetical protein
MYHAYDAPFRHLKSGSWGVDEFDLLTDPGAASNVTEFSYGPVVVDGVWVPPNLGLLLNTRLRWRNAYRLSRSGKRMRSANVLLEAHTMGQLGHDQDTWFREIVARSGERMGIYPRYEQEYNSGVFRRRRRDMGGASKAFKAAGEGARNAGDSEMASRAFFELGVTLSEAKDAEGAKRAYRSAIECKGRECGAKAANNLGGLLMMGGNVEEARRSFELGIASGLPEAVAVGNRNLADIFIAEGNLEGASAALEAVIAAGEVPLACEAARQLGGLAASRCEPGGEPGDAAPEVVARHWNTGVREMYRIGYANGRNAKRHGPSLGTAPGK